jgi:molybdate transport system substrate-binding protein
MFNRAFFLAILQLFIVITANVSFAKMHSKEENIQLTIAVAANFAPTLAQLIPLFEKSTNIKVQIVNGSTGNLFQQIHYGAPYDIYISADTLRPIKLVESGLAHKSSLHTYTFGKIAFWSASWQKHVTVPTLATVFQTIKEGNAKFAMANPIIAPYGLAAKQALKNHNIWQTLNPKNMIIGSNINQTFQQLRSGAVPLGIVANSQLSVNNLRGIEIPTSSYYPIEQQLVILKSSKYPLQAQRLVAFILSDKSQNLIEKNGYSQVKSMAKKTVNQHD